MQTPATATRPGQVRSQRHRRPGSPAGPSRKTLRDRVAPGRPTCSQPVWNASGTCPIDRKVRANISTCTSEQRPHARADPVDGDQPEQANTVATPAEPEVQQRSPRAVHRGGRRRRGRSRRTSTSGRRDQRAQRGVERSGQRAAAAVVPGASSRRSKKPPSMSSAVIPAAPTPGEGRALRSRRTASSSRRRCRCRSPRRRLIPSKEPVKATTKKTGITMVGMNSDGLRRMRCIARTASAAVTAERRGAPGERRRASRRLQPATQEHDSASATVTRPRALR